MREDYPYMCQAMGEWFERFNVTNPLVMTDMRSFENCRKPLIERPHDEYHMYSGWWCCCYSLNMVRNDNLPLPLFIHRDDIEYEVRNKEINLKTFMPDIKTIQKNNSSFFVPNFIFNIITMNKQR